MKWAPCFASFTLATLALAAGMAGCAKDDSDTTPPAVSSTSPASGSVGIPMSAAVTVTFSEAIDAATVNGTTFTLVDSGGHARTGSVSTTGSTVTFTPASALDPLTTYTATATMGIKDTSGNALNHDHAWHFTTVTTPSPLISAAVLKEWVDNGAVNRASGDDRVVVLDVGSTTYAAGHIPGAQSVSGGSISENRQEGPAVDVTMVLDGASMDALVQSLGIDGRTTVVFTGSGASLLSVTRAYWMFRYWGFPKEMLKLLDGLNVGWGAAGYTLVADVPTIAPSTYSVKRNGALRPELRASLSEMIALASNPQRTEVILDARTAATAGSYAGIAGSTTGVFAPTGDVVVFEGRIKGAKALDYKTLYNGTTFEFAARDAAITSFASVGITQDTPVYVHCRTGMIASLPFFVLDAILDWPAANYDGSWSQWGQMSASTTNGGRLTATSPWQTDVLSEKPDGTQVTYNHAALPTPFAVELLTRDGASCSGTLDGAGNAVYTPTGCDATYAPDSDLLLAEGNQIEVADAAYMTAP